MEAGVILVVDDEPDILSMVGMLLEEEGHVVACFGHPLDVVHPPEDSQPSLLFIDLMMPGMSGIDLARTLRADGYSNSVMIAMSASSAMLQRAHESHLFQETLAKPFDLQEMLDYAERYAA